MSIERAGMIKNAKATVCERSTTTATFPWVKNIAPEMVDGKSKF